MRLTRPIQIVRYSLSAGLSVGLLALSACTSCEDRRPEDVGDGSSDASVDTLDSAAVGDAVDADDATPEADGDASTDAAEDADTEPTVDGDDGGDADVVEPTCGDGVVEGGEACDDGNREDDDYCSADCSKATGSCGDGVLQSNETCDDGEITSDCDTYRDGGDGTCRPPGECSSGYVWDGDACVEERTNEHVHISISNTCKLSVKPKSLTLRNGRTAEITYHNHSNSYSADVIYSGGGGGFYDLKPGRTWKSKVIRCNNVNRPYTEEVEITVHGFPVNDSRCPGHRFKIYCK